ncbi:ProQ/FINO family protein [Noviherbaspirillum aerium]|uniref:ProQ/FINO family protein n=1 Tax=Noviherbaspirillum aerium TaxID=2588497 RepID=UPI00124DD5B5|nr:ProQ/FinO family protein [Noviherbaspirillum aerium]
MTAPTPTEVAPTSPRQLLKTLHQKYQVFRDYLPLAIGIDKQILAENSDIDRKLLRVALSIHTNSTPYLKAVERASARAELSGNPSGEITDAHRTRAKEMLAERYKKIAEERKAKREAEIAERRRAEKLQQLAEKFSKK